MKSSPKNRKPAKAEKPPPETSERIAKRMARAGLCSRREAERWVEAGRVSVNGVMLKTPAITVSDQDRVEVDGEALPALERTRLWLFHKPAKTVTTNRDPEGRKTVYDVLPKDLPRVMSIGRLDIATEGLLLLTNDGGLARALELPATGWLRRYKVRAHGRIEQPQLDRLQEGMAVDGILYGAIEATLDRQQGDNCWLTLAFREGKNREVKNVLAALGLTVNRLIRLSYGPFQLADLEPGIVREIRGRTLREQLGERLIREAGANFDAPVVQRNKSPEKTASTPVKPKRAKFETAKDKKERALARLTTRPDAFGEETPQGKRRRSRPGKSATPGRHGSMRNNNADRRR